MASVQWQTIKDWLSVSKVNADDFNEQITNNMRWLFEKNISVAYRAGVADLTETDTTAPTVSAFNQVFDIQIEKGVDTALLATFSGQIYQNTNAAYVNFDILVDNSYFASSNTITPETNGLFYQQFPSANRGVALAMQRFLTNLADGVHSLKLVWWVSAGIGTINLTNSVCQFSIEEYGIPDFQ